LALQNRRFASPKTLKRPPITEVEDLRFSLMSGFEWFHLKSVSSPCAPTAQDDTEQFAYTLGIQLHIQLQTKSSWRKSIIL
jgi:hypothetical protein